MRKIITIAESVLDTTYRNGQPVRSFVGGRIPCAAASLAQAGLPTFMVSECTTDCVGDLVVDYLVKHNVDVKSVDRYPDGNTPFSAIFEQPDGSSKIVNYGNYPKDRFNVIWPRIDQDDIVVFGSLYAVDLPQRERLYELVSYAAERKAIIVYLPGFQHGINFRITRVMPNILENLELSTIVIGHELDINSIFPGESADEAFRNHIEFYCNSYVHITPELSVKRYSKHSSEQVTAAEPAVANKLGWQAGLTAGIVAMLIAQGVTYDSLPTLDNATWNKIISGATKWAQASTGNDNCVDAAFAAEQAATLAQAQQQYEDSKQ